MSKDKRPMSGRGKRTEGDPGQGLGVFGTGADHNSSPGQAIQPGSACAEAAPVDVGELGGPAPGISVVGLGGSAGALECFNAFFEAMPSDSGAAFVVIQHLAPAHESLLTELLATHTSMKVAQAQDGVPVEPNRVYVIPPRRDLGIRDGILCLAEAVKHNGIHMPIDFFFRSLAQDRRERAVCVLFSGAGSDGTLGVRAIRSLGGLAIAQDPKTAQCGDMPRSAIATKLVDYILPPGEIPQTITDYLRQPYVRGIGAAVAETPGKPGGLNEVLAIVQARTGVDFRCYKKGTILRRIQRRMGLRHVSDMTEYCRLLRGDGDETVQLHKDLLINVTAFFRDAEAFEELASKAIAPIIAAKAPDEPLRSWVPGCATGEEAYSLAMLLIEQMTAAGKACPVQVVATDIDEEALEFARRGVYPESIVADVRPERLSRFFIRKEQGYQVSQAVRSAVVFAAQNLITDPPFSRMDLISCRNLLIYLDGETQLKLFPLFNFALHSNGYLFLGKSEGVGGQSELFSLVAKKANIYRRNAPGRPVIVNYPTLPGRKNVFPLGPAATKPPGAVHYADAIRQALLGHFAASVVLADRKGQILQFHGQTGKYLDMPTAEPNLNLLDIAKEGLALPLRSALHAAADKGKSVVLDPVRITRELGSPFVRVTVAPLPPRGEPEGLLAVIFEDVARPAAAQAEPPPGEGSAAVTRGLEEEVRATQQDLQPSIEELQTANEELETSKEELQSVNEELTTVNSQLQEKAERLAAANSDMVNLLKSTQIGALFLDEQLRIKFFTPAAERVLKWMRSDVGRPITDLASSFVSYDFTADARAVAQGGPVLEREARHADGSVYHVRIMPYLAQADGRQAARTEGVVATFDDVTRLRRAEERSRLLATVVTDSNAAVMLFDMEGNIRSWNRGAQAMYGWSDEEALRMNVRDLSPEDAAAGLADVKRRLLAGERIPSYETRRRAKDGRLLDVWTTITAVTDEFKKIIALATTERDITQRKATEESLAAVAAELRRSNSELEQFAYIASHDLQEPLRMVSGFLRLLEERYKPQLDEKAREFIDFSVEGAIRMSQLITDLLVYSRVGRKDITMERVDAKGPLEAALANLRANMREAGAVVTHDELPRVLGNEVQLTQLFQNLIGNAIKFRCPDRPCLVHVGAEKKDGLWDFSVRDNGLGIDPAQAHRVFVIFQQLHVRGKYAGTGMGLAICKKIVERHGGRMWVESVPGQGSTFHFTLPGEGPGQ